MATRLLKNNNLQKYLNLQPSGARDRKIPGFPRKGNDLARHSGLTPVEFSTESAPEVANKLQTARAPRCVTGNRRLAGPRASGDRGNPDPWGER